MKSNLSRISATHLAVSKLVILAIDVLACGPDYVKALHDLKENRHRATETACIDFFNLDILHSGKAKNVLRRTWRLEFGRECIVKPPKRADLVACMINDNFSRKTFLQRYEQVVDSTHLISTREITLSSITAMAPTLSPITTS